MKKRIMALLLSLVLCLSMGSSVMASSDLEGTYLHQAKAIIEGTEVELIRSADVVQTYETVFQPLYESMNEVWRQYWSEGVMSDEERDQKIEELIDEFYKKIIKDYAGVTVEHVEAYSIGYDLPEGIQMPMGGVDVTLFGLDYVTAGDDIILLNFTASGVESLPVTVSDHAVTARFTSMPICAEMCCVSGISSEETPPSNEEVSSRATAEINGEKFGLIIEDDTLRSANEAETATYNEFVEPLNQAATGEEKAAYLNQALRRYPNANTFTTYEKIDWSKDANVYLPEGVQMPTGGIDVTIADPDVSAGDQIVMLHITKDGDLERVRNVIVQEGSITGHFDSLSPVIYFAVAKVQNKVQFWESANSQQTADVGQQDSADKSAGTASTKGSPKTGEPDMVVPASLLAMLAVAGAAYFGRRRFCGR